MERPLEEFVAEGMREIIGFVQASERIRSLLAIVRAQADEMLALAQLDPELLPELDAAAEHMSDAVDALARAQTFLSARMNAKLENL